MPEVAGCYSDTGSTNENEVYYSETGTTDAQQNVVGAFDLGETGAPDVSASQPHRRSSRAPYHATRAGVSWQCSVFDWLQSHVRKDLYVGTPYVCSHYYTAAAVRTQRRLTGSVCLYWNMYTKRTWPVRCSGQCEVYRGGLNDSVE